MSGFELRWYQREAVDAVFSYFQKRQGAPLIVLPTGAGKSLTGATLIKEAIDAHPPTRIAYVAHVAELVEQGAQAIDRFYPQLSHRVGIYSAGLNRKQTNAQITFASIQSIHKKAEALGAFDLVIVDECHRISPRNAGQYFNFISASKRLNPNLAVVGMTATPYRMGQGYLTQGKGSLFTSICYEVSVGRLIEEGYLSQLVTHSSEISYDVDGVKTRMGEFASKALQEKVENAEAVTIAAVGDMVTRCREQGRKSWLVFATSVAHAHQIHEYVRAYGETCAVITGKTDSSIRKRCIEDYRAGAIRCLVSCETLTTGFDAPATDVVAMMRPTASPGLYSQIVGRGLRIAPGKRDCAVLDYAGNIERHGPIDDIKPPKPPKAGGKASYKMCPKCKHEGIAPAVRFCPECDHEFEFQTEEKIFDRPSGSAILSSQVKAKEAVKPEIVKIDDVTFRRHVKEGKPDSVRVTYRKGVRQIASEWICVGHDGFARRKAKQWVTQHFGEEAARKIDEADDPVEVAIELMQSSGVRDVMIEVVPDGKYVKVTRSEFKTGTAEEHGHFARGPVGAAQKARAILREHGFLIPTQIAAKASGDERHVAVASEVRRVGVKEFARQAGLALEYARTPKGKIPVLFNEGEAPSAQAVAQGLACYDPDWVEWQGERVQLNAQPHARLYNVLRPMEAAPSSLEEVARAMGKSASTVQRALREAGLAGGLLGAQELWCRLHAENKEAKDEIGLDDSQEFLW